MLLMLSCELVTVKLVGAIRVTPLTVMSILPLVAPAGTVTWMLPAVSPVMVAGVPLKVTAALPPPSRRFVPVMVTGVPTGPLVGETFWIVGKGWKVKAIPLLDCPFTVTTMLPVAALLGT